MGSVQSFATPGVYIVPNSADPEKGLVFIIFIYARDLYIAIMTAQII